MNEEGLSDPKRLRQILRWMQVPEEHVRSLDLKWLAHHLDEFDHLPHYPEARALIVKLLAPDRHGKSRRIQ